MTEPGTGEAAGPSDYRLLVPDSWFRIVLEPDLRKAAIAALVERQFKGVDDAPHLKEQIRKDMLRRAAKAHRNGGIELYLSLQAAGRVTIPASLLITLAPPPHPGEVPPEVLAQHLSDTGPIGQDVKIVRLQSGDSVRVRTRTEPDKDDPTGNTLPITAVDHHLPVPGTDAYLLLSFSTPLDPIADAMARLFDAVADSLIWWD